MSECYWGWAAEDSLRQGGENGGFVTSLLQSTLGEYDRVIAVKKTGTVFEGTVFCAQEKGDIPKMQGALHSMCSNMAHYIKKGVRTAIVVKPCDARAVIENLKRNHVNREEILLIGLNCGGTLPPVKTKQYVEEELGVAAKDVVKEEIAKGNLIFFTDSDELARSIDELEDAGWGRRENCRYCDVKIPSMCDMACGNWGTPANKNITFVEVFTEQGAAVLKSAVDQGYVAVKEPSEKLAAIRLKINGIMGKMAKKWKSKLLDPVLEMPQQQRLEYFQKTLAPCIGCHACRKACPVCNCSDDCKCMQEDPDDTMPISMFHSIRLLHLMESCVGCGNCTDVCPVDIPLAHLHQVFAKTYEERHKYKPGMSVEDVPPLSRGDLIEGY